MIRLNGPHNGRKSWTKLTEKHTNILKICHVAWDGVTAFGMNAEKHSQD